MMHNSGRGVAAERRSRSEGGRVVGQEAMPHGAEGGRAECGGAECGGRAGAVPGLEHELILLSRHSLQRSRRQELDRSAYILLGRLELADAMSLKEIATVCALDISTINRQVGMLERKGLVERVVDPGGAVARKIRPTRLGLERLQADRVTSCDGVRRVVQGWPAARVELLRELLLEFNTGIEDLEGQRWPRP